MIELEDLSASFLDAERIAARIREDGYALLRGFYDADAIDAARRDIVRTIADFGWLAAGSDPEELIPGDERRVEGDPGYWDGYFAVQSLESVHRLAHQPDVVAFFARLVGAEVTVHPRKFVRIMWPDPAVTTQPHQDFTHVAAPVDFFTAWTPLSACPRELGGLKVLRGSHDQGVRVLRPAAGAGGMRAVGVDDDDPAWATTDFEAGDALVFHSMTLHAGMPNLSGRLRLSIDNRYQAASEALTTWSARPHFYKDYPRLTVDWPEFTAGWSTEEWVQFPEGVELVDVAPMTPAAEALTGLSPASRFADTSALAAELGVARSDA